MKMDPKDGASVQAELMTIEEFERLPDDGWQRELVRGHVIKAPPAGFRHSNLGVRLASLLQRFVDDCGLGEVTGADCGFILFDEPPTVRAPDVAFVAGDRLTFDTERFAPLAPDLAVEIVSPSNTVSEIYEKAMNYLQAGTRLVWVVEPRSRSVTVYRSPADIRLLTGEASIEGEDVLPGFRLSLSALFDH